MDKETILLAGLAEVDSLFEKIQHLATLPLQEPEAGRFGGTAEWAATLVLARRGDKASLNKLLDFAERQDIHTQVVFISQNLQYVPQPEVVNYLREFLDSDERLEPFAPTLMGPPIANYAAASLSKILKGFPVGFEEDYTYSKEEIDICRQWMTSQKEWQFK